MLKVSIVIPTLNEEKNIANCLNSIFSQDYPKELLQVIVIDGNSKDKTVEIAKKLGAEVHVKGLLNEELKRPYGIKKYAKGEIIGSIDADNVIPDDKNWLRKMLLPFKDPEICFTDTLYYVTRKDDNIFTKYCALVGGDDPIASYLGINDRYCYFTGVWTKAPHKDFDKKGYIKSYIDKEIVPALGSNGFFFRKKLFNKVENYPFIHSLFVYRLSKKGYNVIGKVKQGLIHVQKNSILAFFRKKLRRMKRRESGEIKLEYNYGIQKKEIIKLALYILTIVLPIKDAIKGYKRKPSIAWILHPFISFTLLFIYVFYSLKKIKIKYQ